MDNVQKEAAFFLDYFPKERMFLVNMNSGFCQCPLGRSCGPCKHKTAIARHRGFAGLSVVPKNDPRMRAFWHYIAIGSIQPEWLYRDENDVKELNLKQFIEEKIKETNESYEEEGIENGECDENSSNEMDEGNFEVDKDVEDLVTKFSKLWNRFGERVAHEIQNNPEDIEWQKCAKASMKILNEVDSYRPMTLRKHLHMFCTELVGKKEKGRKKGIINVQPPALRISKANGTTRKGKKSLGGTGKFKDRSGETANFILPSGEDITLPGLHQKRKEPTRPEHRLSKAVSNGKTRPKRHNKQ